ncbi:MAG: hypothetical protein SOZ98_10375, partial [Sodaliphilus sp.]|nr:hypothetical protein [Sodaliphilus sp.]
YYLELGNKFYTKIATLIGSSKCFGLKIDLKGLFRFSGKNTGGRRNKKHKKQPFSDASASHLSLVLWHV